MEIFIRNVNVILCGLAFFCFMFLLANAASADLVEQPLSKNRDGQTTQHEDRVYIVTKYRYIPSTSEVNADTGQALCGTRCNSFSVDYQNFVKPPGWRLILLAKGKELSLGLKNPFIGGKCICVADEYIVKVNDLYMAK